MDSSDWKYPLSLGDAYLFSTGLPKEEDPYPDMEAMWRCKEMSPMVHDQEMLVSDRLVKKDEPSDVTVPQPSMPVSDQPVEEVEQKRRSGRHTDQKRKAYCVDDDDEDEEKSKGETRKKRNTESAAKYRKNHKKKFEEMEREIKLLKEEKALQIKLLKEEKEQEIKLLKEERAERCAKEVKLKEKLSQLEKELADLKKTNAELNQLIFNVGSSW
jgi:hypothetical protein